MSFFLLLTVALLTWLGWRSVRTIQRSTSDRERNLAFRASITLSMLGVIFLGGLYALPGRARILLLIPMVLVMGGAAKAYFKSRKQIRAAVDLDARMERMKRVN